jgi:demethylmenaquinone methyltransferase/2-methoxy-6-polyprenyl-1,4-benzoquinol methylase
VDEARALVDELAWRGRHVLEIAPGTGLWTERLLAAGASVNAVDASPAMLDQLRQRVSDNAQLVTQIGDAFALDGREEFDGCFFGFWISHVPRARLGEFAASVAGALRPGGIVAFVDSRREESSTARDHVLPEEGEVLTRRLDDGREFAIVKNFYEPAELTEAFGDVGVALEVRTTERYFIVGRGSRLR